MQAVVPTCISCLFFIQPPADLLCRIPCGSNHSRCQGTFFFCAFVAVALQRRWRKDSKLTTFSLPKSSFFNIGSIFSGRLILRFSPARPDAVNHLCGSWS